MKEEGAMSDETGRTEAVRDPDMDGRCEPEARWWRCPGCGRRYGWPAYEVSARDGEAE